MGDSLKEEFQLKNLGLQHPDVRVFVRSQWSLPKWTYPAWRAFWLVWHVTWIIVSGIRTSNTVAEDKEDGYKWLFLLSNVTFLFTTIVCLLDFVLVLLATCSDGNKSSANAVQSSASPNSLSNSDNDEILFQGEFTLVQGMKLPQTPCHFKLVWMLYEAMNCANLLTTIMFWAVEYQGEVIYADVIVFNVINTVFVVSNLMVAAYPVYLLHFIYPAIYAIAYFLYNLIFYLSDGKDFRGSDVTFEGLDWGDAMPTAVTIVVGLLVAVPLGHLVFFTLYTFRVYVAMRRVTSSSASETTYPDRYTRRISHGANDNVQSGQSNRGFEMEMDSPQPSGN